MNKINWKKAREEYPKDFQNVACVTYKENRTHHKWGIIIGDFDSDEYFRHKEHKEIWEWARVNTGFDDWTPYSDVKYWCPYGEFLKYIKKTII